MRVMGSKCRWFAVSGLAQLLFVGRIGVVDV